MIITPDLTQGVDLSHHNPLSIWAEIDALTTRTKMPVQWAVIKATLWQRQHGHIVDDKLHAHWEQGRSRGYELTGYGWLDSRVDPVEQADHLWRTIEPLKPELRPVVDWEPGEDWASGKRERWSEPRLEHAAIWIERMFDLCGQYPIVYCGKGYLEEVGVKENELLEQCPLWVSYYGPSLVEWNGMPIGEPLLPHPWGEMAAYQFTPGPHEYKGQKRHQGWPLLDRNVGFLDRLRLSRPAIPRPLPIDFQPLTRGVLNAEAKARDEMLREQND